MFGFLGENTEAGNAILEELDFRFENARKACAPTSDYVSSLATFMQAFNDLLKIRESVSKKLSYGNWLYTPDEFNAKARAVQLEWSGRLRQMYEDCTRKPGVKESPFAAITKALTGPMTVQQQIAPPAPYVYTGEPEFVIGETGFQEEKLAIQAELANRPPASQVGILAQPSAARNTPVQVSTFDQALKLAEAILGPFAQAQAQVLATQLTASGPRTVYLPRVTASVVQQSYFNWPLLLGGLMIAGIGAYFVYRRNR